MIFSEWVSIGYLISASLFILGLKKLGHPRTAPPVKDERQWMRWCPSSRNTAERVAPHKEKNWLRKHVHRYRDGNGGNH